MPERGSDPGNPSSGRWRIYFKSDGLYFIEDNGTVVGPLSAGGLAALVDDTSPQLGGDLDLNGNNIDFPSVVNISDVKDEDNMASNSATMLATQQSIKAYADTKKGRQLFLLNGYADTIPAGATRYMPLHEDGGVWSAAYNDLIAAAGVMKNAYFNTLSAQSATGSLVFTLQDDGVDTALVVTVPAGSGAGQFNDLAHEVSIAAGSLCQWKIVNNASATSAQIIAGSCMMEFT